MIYLSLAVVLTDTISGEMLKVNAKGRERLLTHRGAGALAPEVISRVGGRAEKLSKLSGRGGGL